MSVRKILFIVVFVTIFSSCSVQRRMTYLQNLEIGKEYPAASAPELIVRKGDELKISVSSTEPSLAAPFNSKRVFREDMMISDGAPVQEDESTSEGTSYIVDDNGNIDFPVLGLVKASGLTLRNIRDNLSEMIIRLGYIKEPMIDISIVNFTITVIGEVSNKGNFPIKGDRINVIQAIAISGDLLSTAKLKDVTVIRTEGDKRIAYALDLRSKDLFDSPAFFLQQNDIVYVKPLGTKMSSGGELLLSLTQLGLSVATIVTNAILWSSR